MGRKRMNKFWKVVCWILFWYYLAPYYLLKRFVFKNTKHKIRWSAISSVAIIFVLFVCAVGSSDPDDNYETANSNDNTHVVVKKVGTKRLKKANAKQKVLKKEEKDKEAEYEKLASELSAVKVKKEKEEKEEKRQQAKEKKKQEKQAQKQQVQTSDTTNNGSDSDSEGSGNGNRDLNTEKTGQIVGNKNTHIYHLPGQAGYNMNSANAVFFKTEQDAINAGYRKAKR